MEVDLIASIDVKLGCPLLRDCEIFANLRIAFVSSYSCGWVKSGAGVEESEWWSTVEQSRARWAGAEAAATPVK